ncbi:L-serine dehydratase 1 [bioreactor metagenome]|uniref:L-serine dehydratase 1 n=1 Tax=bioreactor metagenome TaxID=1076179 RepID=A0A645DJN5_9ZZZZ
MKYECFDSDGNLLDKPWLVFSVGGGELAEEGERRETRTVYPFLNFSEIVRHAEENGIPLWQIVTENEGNGIRDFFAEVWGQMQTTIHNGLNHEGVLPGGLKFPRKAAAFYAQTRALGKSWRTRTGLISSYALAVSEENAGHGIVVTAPTCGSCGVLPAVLRYLFERLPCTENEILQALAVAGLVGNTAKCNASISGAEVGCQGEVGVACAMAAAACAQLLGGSADQVEDAAEIGLEHFLGLTCDPVMGLVQIPCIERNVVAANKALAAAEYALFSDGRHRVSLDTVIRAMKDTGHDLPSLYRETSQGGLAVALAHRTLTCS